MNRFSILRTLTLGLVTLAAGAVCMAGPLEQAQLRQVQSLAVTDPQINVDLQIWMDSNDEITRLVLASGLIPNEMREQGEAAFEVEMLARAEGLVTPGLRAQIEQEAAAALAAHSLAVAAL